MKTVKFFLLVAALFLLSSCAYRVFPPKDLEFNYNMRMKTMEELNAKSKVKIFYSENEVKEEYKLIAYASYRPFVIPIFVNAEKKMKKKFLQKAVVKAESLGGNGIIIMGAGHVNGLFKVISLTNWDSDSEAPAKFDNAIFDKSLAKKFLDGTVLNATKKEIKQYEDSFESEISVNIEYAQTFEEADVISEKIDIYEKYNASLEKPKSSITKAIENFREDVEDLKGDIQKRLDKEAKKAAKAAKKEQ